MKKLFKNLKAKYFPDLKTQLRIFKERKPPQGTKCVSAWCSISGEFVFVKSWAKHFDDNFLKAIIIHELTHATFGNSSSRFHPKRFASKLMKIYKQEFPTTHKSILRRQFWHIDEFQTKSGQAVIKTYWPEKIK